MTQHPFVLCCIAAQPANAGASLRSGYSLENTPITTITKQFIPECPHTQDLNLVPADPNLVNEYLPSGQ